MHAETYSVGEENEATEERPGFVGFREEVKGWGVRLGYVMLG